MRCIDVDSHIFPTDWMCHMEEAYRSKLPEYHFDNHGLMTSESSLDRDPNPFSVNPFPLHSHNSHVGRYDVLARKQDLKTLGVDFQVLCPEDHAMRFSYLTESEMARQMAYSYNRVINEIVRQNQNVFAAALLVPLQDMAWSLQEIDWGKKNGFNSIVIDTSWPIPTDPASLPLAAMPDIDRLLDRCQDQNMLIICHHQQHHRFINARPDSVKYKLKDLYPNSHKVALISLVTSGLLDQYPQSQILIAEGGMEFIKESFDYLVKIKVPDPMRYFRKNFYFTIETEDPDLLRESIDMFGADRFLFATDYPHDDPGGKGRFQDRQHMDQLGLSTNDLALVLSGNAQRLFKI